MLRNISMVMGEFMEAIVVRAHGKINLTLDVLKGAAMVTMNPQHYAVDSSG